MMSTDTKSRERHQYLSRPDVKEYLLNYPDATAEEKRDLVKWLKAGEDPFNNDCYLYNEHGDPMDFIDARRVLMAIYKQHLDELNDSVVSCETIMDDCDDLPF